MNELVDAIWRRLPLILLCGIIGALVPLGMNLSAPDSYRATARLFVGTAAQDVASASQGDIAAKSRATTYAALATGPELMTRAATKSGESISGGDLASAVEVSSPPDTVLLDITATADRPDIAARYAQAVADELIAAVTRAEKPLRGGQPSIGLLALQPAAAGISQVPVVDPKEIAMYAAGGLAVGGVLALLIPARFRFVRRGAKKARGKSAATPDPQADGVAPGGGVLEGGTPEGETPVGAAPLDRGLEDGALADGVPGDGPSAGGAETTAELPSTSRHQAVGAAPGDGR